MVCDCVVVVEDVVFVDDVVDVFVDVVLVQLVEAVQARQPEVESVLARADQLYKDSPPGQPEKVWNRK